VRDAGGQHHGYYVTTHNNTVATFKKVFEEAIAVGHLLARPAAGL
jgi:hypothetical protein